MRYGGDPDKLEFLRAAAAKGYHISALEKEPDLYPDLADMAEAFLALAASRPPSMGSKAAAIPLSEMAAYLSMFPDPDPQRFVRLIQAMDREYRDVSQRSPIQPAK